MIEQNQKVYIRTNNQDYDTLFIYAVPLKPPIPENALYFGPGVHNIGADYKLSATDQHIYIDGGAWVVGSLNITTAVNAGNVTIMGPGVLSGEFEIWENLNSIPWEDTFPSMMIHNDLNSSPIHNVEISGITIVASPFYNIAFYGLNGFKYIDNIHIISPWTANTDGLNLGSKGHTTNSFIFNNDDTLHGEYIYDGDMDASDCVIAGRNPFLIGYGYFGSGNPYYASFSNIDLIIQDRYFSFHGEVDGINSEIIIDNQIYSDITVDGDVNRLIYLSIEDTGWGAPNAAQGNIRDLVFENITIKGNQINKSIIKGKDANNRIDNIQFTNLIINGTHVTNENYTQYFIIDTNTASVSFN